MFSPLEGWRLRQSPRSHTTAVDYAHVVKDVADRSLFHLHSVLVHTLSHPQQRLPFMTFPPPKPADFERSMGTTTPKHGSWLDLAESELWSFRSMPRPPSPEQTTSSNNRRLGANRMPPHPRSPPNWHFTTPNDAVQLTLYPSI